MKKLLFLLILTVIVFSGCSNEKELSFKGQIINSITNEQISNVLVELSVSEMQAHGSYGPSIVVDKDVTNTEGLFLLNNSISSSDSEPSVSIIVSAKGYYPTLINQNKENPFDYGRIEITPEVESLEECKEDSLCISENSFYLAMKNKDVRLCKQISIHDKFTSDSYYKTYSNLGIRCIEMFAINNNDANMCNLINELDLSNKERKIEICIQNIDRREEIPCETIKVENQQRFNYEREIQICRSTFEN